MFHLFEKLSSLGPGFIQAGRDAWNKNIDRIFSKRVQGKPFNGSFTFQYEVPEEIVKKMKSYPWVDKSSFILTVVVRFSPLKALKGGHKKGESFGTRKLIVINSDNGTYLDNESLKKKMYSIYIHELQHIPQEYNSLQDWSQFKSSQRFQSIKSKTKSWSKFWQRGDHDKRESEHEANLAQLLELIANEDFDAAVDFVLNHASYMHFSFKQFVHKAYYWGCTGEQIFKFRQLVQRDLERGSTDVHISEVQRIQNLLNVFEMLKVGKKQVEILLQHLKERLEKVKEQLQSASDNKKDYLQRNLAYLQEQIPALEKLFATL